MHALIRVRWCAQKSLCLSACSHKVGSVACNCPSSEDYPRQILQRCYHHKTYDKRVNQLLQVRKSSNAYGIIDQSNWPCRCTAEAIDTLYSWSHLSIRDDEELSVTCKWRSLEVSCSLETRYYRRGTAPSCSWSLHCTAYHCTSYDHHPPMGLMLLSCLPFKLIAHWFKMTNFRGFFCLIPLNAYVVIYHFFIPL